MEKFDLTSTMTRRALVVALAIAASVAVVQAFRPAVSSEPKAARDINSTIAQRPQPDPLADLRRAFLEPPDDSRIMMRWWWFGPAVTKPQLERELNLMKLGRIGGVEVQPVYPLALDDPDRHIRNLTFLSDEFIDALRFAADKARALGMRVDVTLGSGWPYGGPQVGIDSAAGKLRIERASVGAGVRRVPVPSIGAGERLIAVFLTSPDPSSPAHELTDVRDGVVHLPAAFDTSRDVQFFIASRSGMMVKRPAAGAEGFVLNHYDRGALDGYLAHVGDRLLQAFDGKPPYAIFCDSLEVYESDWTTDFLDQFRIRRGYDLKPHLPALATDIGPRTPAVRHDWGRTLTELLNERFVAPLQEWARARGTRLRIQGYGIPPATLSTAGLADLPEGEGFQWKTLSSTRWASSASHIYGRPVTSSETWTWLHSPVFRATPLDVKAEADLHFLQGINQLIGHGWPYTAEGVDYPGWRFYAAGVFNDKNPWWIVMPDVSLYLQRLSFLMRQGDPVADVAVYLPTSDAWSHFSPGHANLIETLRDRLGPSVIPQLVNAGFNIDFFDDEALKTAGRVEGNTLRLGRGTYRAVILPGVETMPIETLRTLASFAKGGGTLIATRRLPDAVPGVMATDADHATLGALARDVFQQPGAAGHFIRQEDGDPGTALGRLVRPDVVLSPPSPDVGFVHRRSGDADIYFIANTANVPRSAAATFRVTGMNAEWWNPITGRVSPARPIGSTAEGTTIALDLEPYGSRVLVFSQRLAPAPAPAARAAAPTVLDLSTGWTVTFLPNGPSVSMDRLRSWTGAEETRYFSGTAAYVKEVVVPATLVDRTGGGTLRLDFGEGTPIPPQPLRSGMQAWLDAPVREAAIVSVNDRLAGTVWAPPYSVDVTGLIAPGPNRIRVVVANLAVNDMAGHALPNYRLLNLKYGLRFEAQDMDKIEAVPAGLLGPVRLVAQ